jgi:HlyD family secretion protein
MQPTTTSRPISAPPARSVGRSGLRRRIVGLAVVASLAAGGYAALRWVKSRPPPAIQYRTVPLARRAITGKVVASGTLSALVTVQVGTQVSGRVQKLFVDFNSPVKKGQLVAKIDPQIYQAATDQADGNYLAAEAAVAKTEADARIADRQYVRTKALFQESLASQSDVDNALAATESTHASVDSAKAALVQARAARSQAQVNLSYTNIISPIDGIVISRSVDVGQTVAASLSAPTLFTIAQDLTKMQVDTNVAEADVGRLKVGMETSFTVDAYPGQRFPGKVREIRNAAVTVQNVVTYDAVIDVDNTDLRLRPGMTANVTVIYDERRTALAAPNAALRFHPPGASPKEAPDATTVWTLRGGQLQPAAVHVGLTDGMVTEVVDGDVREGDELVVEAIEPGAAAASGGSLRRLF